MKRTTTAPNDHRTGCRLSVDQTELSMVNRMLHNLYVNGYKGSIGNGRVDITVPSSSSYSGPFAGAITDSDEVTIGGSVPDFVHANRLRARMESPVVVSGITSAAFVYLDIRLINTAIEYDPVLEVTGGFTAQTGGPITYPSQVFYGDGYPSSPHQASLPHMEDVTNKWQIVVGYVGWDSVNSIVSGWTQYHYGNVVVPFKRTYLQYDESAQTIWYIARGSTGTVSRYSQSVPSDTHESVLFDPTGGVLYVGGTTGHTIGAIHTNSSGELLGLYEHRPVYEP